VADPRGTTEAVRASGWPARIESPADLGARLRARREELGYTLTEAAERLGVGRRLLLELEHGERNAGLDTVLRIVQLLGLDLYLEDRRRQPAPRAEPGGPGSGAG